MISKLEKINSNEIIPGFKGKFIHGKNITLAFWNVKKGSSIPIHNHIHEQTLFVKKGIFELEIYNEKKILKKNHVCVIPSNVSHSGKALSDCELIDVFSPARTEYSNKK
tara:strand:+ start:2176 stop:2502 length:327 start_codon:yes stop_codon:yes gene_type:complete